MIYQWESESRVLGSSLITKQNEVRPTRSELQNNTSVTDDD
jgi:hypothetical protein